MTEDTTYYEVGRNKPPKHSQFKPGQSGNPKGRPPDKSSQAIDLDKLLDHRVTAKTSKGEVEMCSYEAQIRKQVEMALKGDLPAIGYVLNVFAKYKAIVPSNTDKLGGVLVVPAMTTVEWNETYGGAHGQG